jgi:hypothetical protein
LAVYQDLPEQRGPGEVFWGVIAVRAEFGYFMRLSAAGSDLILAICILAISTTLFVFYSWLSVKTILRLATRHK